jgi:hypothetical protein
MQPLFLTSSVEFKKTAAQTQLPEDPNAWPHEILQELYKQAPYVADFSPHVVMEKVDGEQGYGLGHVEVGNQTEIQTAATPEQMSAAGVRQVRVPIVIKDGMLSPFDLLVSDNSKVLPLTETRLRAAIFRPQAFDVTSRTPGDQSMIGQLYPPYRQNAGFGGGGMTTNMGMGKEGSALEEFLTDDLKKEAIVGVGFDVGSFADSPGSDVKGTMNVGLPHLVSVNARHKPSGLGLGMGLSGPLVTWSPGTMMKAKRDREALEEVKAIRAERAANQGALSAEMAEPVKTAGAFQDFGDRFLSEDYLHGVEGAKTDRTQVSRFGKKVASGEGRLGMLSEFVEKNASAVRQVAKALAGTPAPKPALQNLAAAKQLAGTAGARAKSVASKSSPSLRKVGSLLAAIRPTIYEGDLLAFKQDIVDPELQSLLFKNAAALTPSIQTLMETPERAKFAEHFGSLVPPSVVQLKRVDEGYRVKAASHLFWAPITQTIDRGEALSRFGDKVVVAADLSGAVTMADGADAMEPEPELGAGHDSDMQEAGPVTEAGLYKVISEEGEEVIGYVIPNLIDIDGTAIPLSLFTNGSMATVQGDIVGSPVEGDAIELPTGDVPQGRGVFASPGPGEVQATIPLTIEASMQGLESGEPTTYKAESFTGESVLVSVQPNIQMATGTEDGKLLIPADWQWVPLDSAEAISVESQEDGLGSKAASARGTETIVELVSGGGGTYSVRGAAVEKLAHDERELLGIDDAMFLLAALGAEQDYAVKKLASAMTGLAPVRVCVGRNIKLASDEVASATERARVKLASLPNLKQRLVKEAATLGDPTAVDTVLSLGFLNPENLMTFVSYLPVLEDAQAKLCDILLASRLGSLIDTPEGAIERSVRSTEAVLEGLKALAFQQN